MDRLTRSVEVEFRIKEDGRVEFAVKGAAGSSCLDVAQAFEQLGEVVETRKTSEYYERGAGAEVSLNRARGDR